MQFYRISFVKHSFLTFIGLSSQQNESYMFADKFLKVKDKSTRIPRILHFQWIFQAIPDNYLDAITEFEKNNPDYQVGDGI